MVLPLTEGVSLGQGMIRDLTFELFAASEAVVRSLMNHNTIAG
jgi:hypothetical protein